MTCKWNQDVLVSIVTMLQAGCWIRIQLAVYKGAFTPVWQILVLRLDLAEAYTMWHCTVLWVLTSISAFTTASVIPTAFRSARRLQASSGKHGQGVKQTTCFHLSHRLMHGITPPLSSPPHDVGINEVLNSWLLHNHVESFFWAHTVQSLGIDIILHLLHLPHIIMGICLHHTLPYTRHINEQINILPKVPH